MLFKILLIVGLVFVSVGLVFLFSYLSYKKRNLSHDTEFVRKMLPGIDCGMCGEKNCTNFAVKVAGGNREPEACKLIRPENGQKIKQYFKNSYKEAIMENVAIQSTDHKKVQDDKDFSVEYDTETTTEDIIDNEVENDEIDMDLVLVEAITKYTLMETLYTLKLEDYSYNNIVKLTRKLVN